MTTPLTAVAADQAAPASVEDLISTSRQRAVALLGYLELNQGLPTFTGRMTLEQFSDYTVVHNRKWAHDAGESLDIVTQREISDAHANGLATFMLQGLVAATIKRADRDEGFPQTVKMALERVQNRVGEGAHYALPPVTLVLPPGPLDVRAVKEEATDTIVAHRLFLSAGRLFIVADGQHRREAARRVREFLTETIANRRTQRGQKFYPAEDAPLAPDEVDAWIGVQDTFRSATLISHEAHIGLGVDQARQLFTNYNCHVKPVRADLNFEFDQSNPINRFGKEWLVNQLPTKEGGGPILDLRQLAGVNGFLFLGKSTIKSAPYNVDNLLHRAREFWTVVIQSQDWGREGTLLREVPILKGLAKAWFYVYQARRNSQPGKADLLRDYIGATQFDWDWAQAVPGLQAHLVPKEDGFRFSPAHNDIVAKIVHSALALPTTQVSVL